MKLQGSYRLSGLKFVVYILITIFLVTTVQAQENEFKQLPNKERAIQNLVIGIQSDNAGLKRSCIYFAGKYEVSEVVNELIELLGKEKDSSTKKVIALVLYKIGDQKGIK
jgi:HEAT repeat protein